MNDSFIDELSSDLEKLTTTLQILKQELAKQTQIKYQIETDLTAINAKETNLATREQVLKVKYTQFQQEKSFVVTKAEETKKKDETLSRQIKVSIVRGTELDKRSDDIKKDEDLIAEANKKVDQRKAELSGQEEKELNLIKREKVLEREKEIDRERKALLAVKEKDIEAKQARLQRLTNL